MPSIAFKIVMYSQKRFQYPVSPDRIRCNRLIFFSCILRIEKQNYVNKTVRIVIDFFLLFFDRNQMSESNFWRWYEPFMFFLALLHVSTSIFAMSESKSRYKIAYTHLIEIYVFKEFLLLWHSFVYCYCCCSFFLLFWFLNISDED